MANHKRMIAGYLLALTTLGGCAGIYDCCYEKTQCLRAMEQYKQCGKPECSCYPHDYKCGWLDGFYEVATGGSDCPPAIAPSKYWKPGQILNDCDNRRHAYYSGWQDGAARASQFPDTHTIRLYETCECPFPKCEKPCIDGTCVPCGQTSVGMPMAEAMIEEPEEQPTSEPLPEATATAQEPVQQNAKKTVQSPAAPEATVAADMPVLPEATAQVESPDAPEAAEAKPEFGPALPGDFQAGKNWDDTSKLPFMPTKPIGNEVDYQTAPKPIRPASIAATDSASRHQSGVIKWTSPTAKAVPAKTVAMPLHQSEMIESDSIVRLATPTQFVR
ncbi:MAG: hypothetical protein AAGJ40_15305 [Planctomycetota bacterium]